VKKWYLEEFKKYSVHVDAVASPGELYKTLTRIAYRS
jgi:hypothetical protein